MKNYLHEVFKIFHLILKSLLIKIMKNLFTFKLYNLSRPFSDAKIRRISESTYTISIFFAYF